MIKRGTSEVVLSFFHPEVDVEETTLVKVDWVYVPEIPSTPDNDYGEPYDFTYDVKVLSAPDWVTLDMVEDALNEMSIFDIMNS